MDTNEKRIVILGGGPTGLGAGYKLKELGYKNWTLYEQHEYAGGHSTTHTDPQGFLWDEGGHVLFSHFPYYDKFVEEALGDNYFRHQRESWVTLPGARVPYPFQNNLRYLPKDAQKECLDGLARVNYGNPTIPKNFAEWIHATFGAGIAKWFMLGYNYKVWATPPEKMSHNWIAERVSMVNFSSALSNVIEGKDDVAWGPNNTFIFPKYGGTGEIYRKGAEMFQDHIQYSKKASKISFTKKEITFTDGEVVHYDLLVNTIPLTVLAEIAVDMPEDVLSASQSLTYNSVAIVGIGLEKNMPTTTCWEYFPDPSIPFNRLTYFHLYSPYNVPNADTEKYSSLMLEVCYSKYKHIKKETILEDCIQGLVDAGVIEGNDVKKIVSETVFDIAYGYPVPTLDRDDLLGRIQPYLLSHGVYSRGRYGAWRYEIANMDHCFMQGAEAVEHALFGKKESVWESE